MTRPHVHSRVEDGRELPFLTWRFDAAQLVASTASCGGGIGERRWIVNAQVAGDYARTDLEQHARELAALTGLAGHGVTLFTAADVSRVGRASDAGVDAAATVGLGYPTWAADEDGAFSAAPGTINIVALLPVRLSPAALLNALCTATEAKSQALWESGVEGTGTASDAVTIVCPPGGPEVIFAGPRSPWGARLARAVHAAVRAGV